MFVEAGAGSGKTSALVERVAALVEDGTPVSAIAAITFTERAAAELRDRIRTRLRAAGRPADAADVDSSAIGTLHSFAQRILTEHPVEARLPPRIEVIDEIASNVAFDERWDALAQHLLDDDELGPVTMDALELGANLSRLRTLAEKLNQNWDLVEDRLAGVALEDVPTDFTTWIESCLECCGQRVHCRDADCGLCTHLRDLEDVLHRAAELEGPDLLRLLQDDLKVRTNAGRAPDWGIPVAEVKARLRELADEFVAARDRVLRARLHRLLVAIGERTLQAAEERRAAGRLEFHDLLVLARQLLRGPHGPEVRRALRDRYRRLLLDEFQDTDPIQLEIAVLLASPAEDPGDAAWIDLTVDDGRLFFVGDPKQSIYRFRRADIGLFLAAAARFGGDATVRLTTNFRTAEPVLAFVNAVFGDLVTEVEAQQPAYVPLDPHWPETGNGPAVVLLGVEAAPERRMADELRDAEAEAVAAAVVASQREAWTVRDGDLLRPARLGDVCILVPARTSVPNLERALAAAGVPYRTETSSLVYVTREVRDLFAALRAIDDPSDQLSLVTALRSPLFGCGDDDLYTYRVVHGGSWSLRAPQRDDAPADHPVVAAMRYLRALHDRRQWTTASALIDAILRDRRVYELGLAGTRHRDLWRRLRFVSDQARAYAEAQGGSLRDFLGWAARQANETGRAKETVLPETDDDAVRIMTIHAAKGLEFPITIVSGMTTAAPGSTNGVSVLFPPDRTIAIKLTKEAKTAGFDLHADVDAQLDLHERIRLLYVAATRARDHLVVSVHRNPEPRGKPTAAEQLWAAAEAHPQTWTTLTDPDPEPLVLDELRSEPAALPERDVWAARRARALVTAGRPRTVAATTLARDAAGAGSADPSTELVPDADSGPDVEADDPGLDKDARDLDLPPWQRGRYGTAIGRAVHAVLQTVDLTTGAGVDEAAAAQAAAEGVLGQEALVARLARSALASATVRTAAGSPHWREVYVAAPHGDRLLEGYIDLLYRVPAGLVVVDYKTDRVEGAAEVDAKLHRYRLQGAAYAAALEDVTAERVVECRFVFCTLGGPIERVLPGLHEAVAEVRGLVAAQATSAYSASEA